MRFRFLNWLSSNLVAEPKSINLTELVCWLTMIFSGLMSLSIDWELPVHDMVLMEKI